VRGPTQSSCGQNRILHGRCSRLYLRPTIQNARPRQAPISSRHDEVAEGYSCPISSEVLRTAGKTADQPPLPKRTPCLFQRPARLSDTSRLSTPTTIAFLYQVNMHRHSVNRER